MKSYRADDAKLYEYKKQEKSFIKIILYLNRRSKAQ
jgi:hypothetical protein